LKKQQYLERSECDKTNFPYGCIFTEEKEVWFYVDTLSDKEAEEACKFDNTMLKVTFEKVDVYYPEENDVVSESTYPKVRY
jgi:hypothetical protein